MDREPAHLTTLPEFCEYAIEALADEYSKAKEKYDSNAVKATSYCEIPNDKDIEALHVYEANVEIKVDDAPPILPGTPIRVCCERQNVKVRGTLLDWDQITNKAYLSFNEPLDKYLQNGAFTINHTSHELIESLQNNLRNIKHLQNSVCWPILSKRYTCSNKKTNLTNSTGLDTSQQKAIERALLNKLSLIWGPPGTGKTYTVARLIWELVSTGHRVLATSISNIAVDNMAIKFLETMPQYSRFFCDYNEGRFLRFGYTKNDELLDNCHRFFIREEKKDLLNKIRCTKDQIRRIGNSDPETKARLKAILKKFEEEKNKLIRAKINNAKVVFTTATQVYTNTAFEDLNSYDSVVIDEASMVYMPIFAILAERSRNKVVAVGDFKQLAPIAESDAKCLHQSIFEWLKLKDSENGEIMDMLYLQRRMAPPIASWISQTFYNSKLENDKSVKSYRPNLPSPLPSSLVFWDLKRSKYYKDDYIVQQSKTHSRYNKRSAVCVSRLSKCLLRLNPNLSIAIITPYRAQTGVIRSEIETMQSDLMKSVLVGTVHAFQGSEADIVIWDLVDTSEKGYGLPFEGDNGSRLINVAVSRAKQLMIVVGDQSSREKIDTTQSAPELLSLLCDTKSYHEIIDEWLKGYMSSSRFMLG